MAQSVHGLARTSERGAERRWEPGMPVPSRVRSALRSAPASAEQLLRALRGGSPAGVADLDDAQQHLNTLDDFLASVDPGDMAAAAEALLADERARVALLRLVAVACRLQLPPLTAAAAAAASVCGGSAPPLAPGPDASAFAAAAYGLTTNLMYFGAPERFALPLVRMGTVQAVARQLAAGAAELSRAGGAVQPDAPSTAAGPSCPQPPRARAFHQRTLAALAKGIAILANVSCAAIRRPGGHASSGGGSSQSAAADKDAPDALCNEVAAALQSSAALEHAARLLVAAMAAPAPLQPPPVVWTEAFRALATWGGFIRVLWMRKSSENNATANAACAAALGSVLSGHCFQQATLMLCVSALCTADGGSSYGLPAQLLQLGRSLVPVVAGGGASYQVCNFTIGTIAAAALGHMRGPSPPGPRARVSLLLRIARLAVRSAEAWAVEGAGGSVALPLRIRKGKEAAESASALEAALLTFNKHPSKSGWWAASGREAWQLVMQTLQPSMLGSVPDWAMGAMARCLTSLADCSGVRDLRASTPPPMLAAALQSGLLPCLERLLRRAGEEPLGNEALLLQQTLQDEQCWPLLAPLLVFGDARAAAALVATLRKLLLRAAAHPSALMASEDGAADSSLLRIVWSAQAANAFLGRAAQMLSEQPLAPRSGQLACMLSLAAREWLPPLSQLALRALLAAPRNGVAGAMAGVLRLVVLWLPLVAWRGVGHVFAAAAGGSGDSGTGGGADAAHWRALLLVDMRAGALLSAALHAGQQASLELGGGFSRRHVELACVAVAAAAAAEARGAESAGWQTSLRWAPEALRTLAAAVEAEGDRGLAVGVRAVAAAVVGGSGGAAGAAEAHGALALYLRAAVDACGDVGVAVALVWPTEAAGVPRVGCSYPRCLRLEGDSEAGAALVACEACGACGYCCGACRAAHWREGHGGVCTRGRGGVGCGP